MRLLTRGDADGLCCAVFLRQKEKIDRIEFVHPKDMQDGKIAVTGEDIIANLPFHPAAALWFDHHASSESDAKKNRFRGNFRVAPSAARVVYEFYKDPALDRFRDLLEATDCMDSANLRVEDVTAPQGWYLMMYTLDPRSGLGPFKDYFLQLLEWVLTMPVAQILALPEVKGRVERLLAEQEGFAAAMRQYSRLEKNVIVTDLRAAGKVPSGNRFLIFTLFPQGNVQARIFNGKAGEFIVVALGHSIFNRTCGTDVGALCARYGGGGHRGAATCQLPLASAEVAIGEIMAALTGAG